MQSALDLQAALAQAIRAAGIPGAALAVWSGDDLTAVAAGVLDVTSGVATAPDSLFQVGSITKTLTATLVLQLRDQGLLSLDDPLAKHLPDLADGPIADVRIRSLLSHAGGIAADIVEDTGDGDDCVARFAAILGRRQPLFAPDLLASYSNPGYVLLGAVCERVAGKCWDALLRDNILVPGQLRHTATRPDELSKLNSSCAVGHYCDPASGRAAPIPGERRLLCCGSHLRSCGPGGYTLHSTAADMVRFARALVTGAPALLAPQSFAEMLVPNTTSLTLPDSPIYGLAWALGQIGGVRVASHGGATTGNNSLLWMAPDKHFAFALLTNTGNGIALLNGLLKDIIASVPGIDLSAPQPPHPPSQPPEAVPAPAIDPTRYAGDYGGGAALFHVRADGDGLVIDYEHMERPDSPQRSGRALLTPLDESRFLSRAADAPGPATPIRFVWLDQRHARADALFFMGRAYRRLDGPGDQR